MVLNFSGIKNKLFKHSQAFEQGFQKRQKRTSDIIVALDGTGDFESLEEAITETNKNNGGTIWIKAGTYIIPENLSISSNTSITGDGWKTELIFYKYLQLLGSNTELKDLKLTFSPIAAGDEIWCDINGASNITFNNVYFNITNTNSSAGVIWTSGGTDATGIRIINCKGDNSGTGDCIRFFYAELDFLIFQGNNFPNWDMNATDADIDHSLIVGNILDHVHLMAGSDNNVVIGNCLDTATTNLGTGNEVANNTLF